MKMQSRDNHIRSLSVLRLMLILLGISVSGGSSARADCSPQAMTKSSCCVVAVDACTCKMPASASGTSLAAHSSHADRLAPAAPLWQPPSGCPCAASPAPVEHTPVNEPTRLLMTVAPTRAPDTLASAVSQRVRFQIADESTPQTAPPCLASPRAPPFQA